jgi:phosphoglycerate dehydrogenase-like enzyme
VDGEPTREKLRAAPNLRAVIQPYTGVSPETAALMREVPHLTLYNSHGPALPTAEMAFALLLAAAKAIVPLDRALRRDDWSARLRPLPSVLLSGKTALLLGYGAIGRHVARMCRGMGMRVLALRRNGDAGLDEFVEIHPAGSLRDLLPRADALIVSLPLTAETRGLIGARELALMPRGAVLVNVGRGPVVDEGALYRALKEGTLGAAGIDVWYTYPDDDEKASATPPSTYPFGELDNVVLSPHRGGLAEEPDQRRERLAALAEIINALARGEEAPNRVDLTRGY